MAGSDIITKPIGGTARGAAKGWLNGGIIGLVAGVAGLLLFSTLGPLGILGWGLVASGVGAAAGTVIGGGAGLVGGTVRGVKGVFSGETRETRMDDQRLEALRRQAAAEAAMTSALQRQQERAQAVNTIGGTPAAATDNAARVQAAKDAQMTTGKAI